MAVELRAKRTLVLFTAGLWWLRLLFYGTDNHPALGMNSERTGLAIQVATQDEVGGHVSNVTEVSEVWHETAGGALRNVLPQQSARFSPAP